MGGESVATPPPLPLFKAIEVCPHLKPKLLTDRMILGGRIYTVDNIQSIPVQELLPAYVFTPRAMGVTAFFSKSSPLSNHYPAPFIFEERKFHSSEQCFMFQKATYLKIRKLQTEYCSQKLQSRQRRIDKRITNFNNKLWHSVAEECMFKAVLSKFSQNEDLADFLRATGNTELVEANPSDTFWGAGMALRDKNIFCKEMWRGKNRAGMVISRMRSHLNK